LTPSSSLQASTARAQKRVKEELKVFLPLLARSCRDIVLQSLAADLA
jgi:hypothetical protein